MATKKKTTSLKEQPPIRIIIEVVVRTEGTGRSAKAGFNTASPGFFELKETELVNPFDFVIKIKKLDSLIVSRIDIQNATLFKEDLKDDPADPTTEVGKASSIVPGGSFLLTIMASGDPFTATTFNMTCDGKKVFDEDQEIKITSSGNGGYRNLAVPLP